MARKPSPVVLTSLPWCSHDAGLDEVALDPFHTAVRSFFIDLHEAAVAGDIARDNRGKTARHNSRGGSPPTVPDLILTNFSHDSDRSPCTATRSVGIHPTAHELRSGERSIPPDCGKAFEASATSRFH